MFKIRFFLKSTQPKELVPWCVDHGRASKMTRGFFQMLFYENGFPPFNTTYFG